MSLNPHALIRLMILYLIVPVSLACADDAPLEDILDGFNTEELGANIEPPEAREDKADLYGKFIVSGNFNNGHGPEEMKTALELNLDARLPWDWNFVSQGRVSHDFAFQMRGRKNFSDAYLSDSETDSDLTAFYLEKSLTPWMDISLGRQIVSWGTSETLRVVDVINPIDRRRYGITDIEDLRLGTTMTRFDVYSTDLHLTTLIVHEVRHDEMPVCGSPFHVGNRPSHYDEGHSSTQYGVRVSGQFDGWDASVNLARVFDDRAYPDQAGTLRYPRVWMLGGVCTAAFGNLLIKTEAAWFDGIRFSPDPDGETSELKTLFGMEYSGFNDTVITWEIMNTHIFSFKPELLASPDAAEEDLLESVLRIERECLNDTLHLILLTGFSGKHLDGGSFQRLEVAYDLTDKTSIKGGAVFYHGGEARFFEAIKNNDMLYLQFEWCFSL
jgi:hypothetical protein